MLRRTPDKRGRPVARRRAWAVALAAAGAGASVATGGLAAGMPQGPPPSVRAPGVVKPPPAWLEKPGRDRWLAFGSFCGLARGGAVACVTEAEIAARRDVPRIRLTEGQQVWFHLGFVPQKLVLTVGEAVYRLRPGGRSPWRVRRKGGLLRIRAVRTNGYASYIAWLNVDAASEGSAGEYRRLTQE